MSQTGGAAAGLRGACIGEETPPGIARILPYDAPIAPILRKAPLSPSQACRLCCRGADAPIKRRARHVQFQVESEVLAHKWDRAIKHLLSPFRAAHRHDEESRSLLLLFSPILLVYVV